uniref:Uncharacterized protein n=1 Tax=Cacopsylla melanoneura TaxID=428564 RepID=A0A8D8Z0B3_9HEMI
MHQLAQVIVKLNQKKICNWIEGERILKIQTEDRQVRLKLSPRHLVQFLRHLLQEKLPRHCQRVMFQEMGQLNSKGQQSKEKIFLQESKALRRSTPLKLATIE